MRKTTHALDAKAADAIEYLSSMLGVSRAEVVRRCAVAMKQQQSQNGALPAVVAQGYSEGDDDRTKRGTSGKDGSLGRAPSLGDLDDRRNGEDSNDGMASSPNGSPESDQRGSDDQDGGGSSILDKQLW